MINKDLLTKYKYKNNKKLAHNKKTNYTLKEYLNTIITDQKTIQNYILKTKTALLTSIKKGHLLLKDSLLIANTLR